MMAKAIKCLASVSRDPKKMITSQNELSTRKKSYNHPDIRFGHRYADILCSSEDGRLRID